LTAFIQGMELSRHFYGDVISKLVKEPHAAALIGEGSEVLGYDQPRSTDHSWGPRLQLFVGKDRVEQVKRAVESGLPLRYRGYPVQFYSWQTGTVRHHVEVCALDDWLESELGVGTAAELTVEKWLSMPQQHLLQFTKGAVYRDDSGSLTRMRERLAWYPTDVWLWMMASQWHLIGNTEHLLGRTAEASDRRGTVMVAARLARLMMELAFLQEKRYWPYLKWFGTAFSELRIAPSLGPVIDDILGAADQESREHAARRALRLLAENHNALKLTSEVTPAFELFKVGINDAVRPYRVLNAGSYVEACKQAITDPELRNTVHVGSIDQLTHADDALINFTGWPGRLQECYRNEMDKPSPHGEGQ